MRQVVSPYPLASRFLWVLPAAATVLFFGFPLATIVARGFSISGFVDTYTNTVILNVLWFTTWQAAASTALCLAISLPATFVLSRYRFFADRLFLAFLTAPFLLPTVIVGAAFLAVLPRQMHYTAFAVIVAHAFFNIAVIVRVVGAQWQQVSPNLADAARTLGVTPARAFVSITMPLLRRSLTMACAIVALFSFTSYGVVRILGGPSRTTLETEIYTRAVFIGDLPGALALSIGQMVVLTLALLVWLKFGGRTHALPTVQSHRIVAQRGRQRVAVVSTVLFTTVAVAAPMVALAWRSLHVSGAFSLAGWDLISSAGTLSALGNSAAFAVAAALLATGFGLLISLAIAYGSPRYRILEAVSALPLTVSAVTIGLGMLITFDVSPIDFRSAWMITPIAHTLIALPLVVRATLPVVSAIPDGIREAAATLGTNSWQRFTSIDWPLVRKPAATAAALSFAVSLGEFGATSFLTRRTSETLPVLIARLLSRTGDTLQAQAYALCTLFVLVSIAAIFVVDSLRAKRMGS